MKKLCAFLGLSLTTLSLNAQFGIGGNGFIGASVGLGSMNGTSYLVDPGSGVRSEGAYVVKGKTLAMTGMISKFGAETGVSFGYYAMLNLGGTPSKWYRTLPFGSGEIVWSKDFSLYADMRIGPQIVYQNTDQEWFAGLRYYNNYAVDAFRASYDNSDDAAVIGAFAAWKKWGLDLGWASAKIPGFLVNSASWNYLQCDLRYKLNVWDEGRMSTVVSLRYERSFLQDTELVGDYGQRGEQHATPNTLMLSVCMAVY